MVIVWMGEFAKVWMGECAKEEIEEKAFDSLAAEWTLVEEAAVIVDAKASRLTRTRSCKIRITLGCKRCQKCATSNQASSHTTSCTVHMALAKKIEEQQNSFAKKNTESKILEYVVWHL